jgi:thiol-disulfide isomerase/thioredoxin
MTMPTCCWTIFLLSLIFKRVHSFGPSSKSAIDVVGSEHWNQVSDSPGTSVLVLFYVPWCRFCKQFMPIFQKFAFNAHHNPVRCLKSLKSSRCVELRVAQIDCQRAKSDNAALCFRAGVTGYPTIHLIHNGKRTNYLAERTFSELAFFVDSFVGTSPNVVSLP